MRISRKIRYTVCKYRGMDPSLWLTAIRSRIRLVYEPDMTANVGTDALMSEERYRIAHVTSA